MKAGAAWLEPNTEPVPCGAAPPAEKLKDGALPVPEAPPNMGAALLMPWFAPKIEPPPPPNWKGEEVPGGAEDPAPNENMPPFEGAADVAELPPAPPEANGLLNPEPDVVVVAAAVEAPPPKLKLKPPEPDPVLVEAPPKPVAPVGSLF